MNVNRSVSVSILDGLLSGVEERFMLWRHHLGNVVLHIVVEDVSCSLHSETVWLVCEHLICLLWVKIATLDKELLQLE